MKNKYVEMTFEKNGIIYYRAMESTKGLSHIAYSLLYMMANIYDLDVLPNYRNRGFGTEILRLAELSAIKNNATEIQLWVVDENLVYWYKKHGYKIVEECDDGTFLMSKKIQED